jgi:hypothetical protein
MRYNFAAWCILLMGGIAQAAESTKVLPKGVRNINLKSVAVSLSEKTDGIGHRVELGAALEKDLTFAQIMSSESAGRAKEIEAFLLANGMNVDDVAGTFTADLRGQLQVNAAVASYGWNDSFTVAVAAPYYRAATDVNVGFVQKPAGQRFVTHLADPYHNQSASAADAAWKLNHAAEGLNDKLARLGYAKLGAWESAGWGDMTLASKKRFYQVGAVAGAWTSGVVAPTGQVDDPNILTDVAFGDGQWDVFGQLALDEQLNSRLILNQYAKFTVQLPDQRNVRVVTATEPLDVPVKRADFDLGDRLEWGTSLNYETAWGFTALVGGSSSHKQADVYRDSSGERMTELENDTEQTATQLELGCGYSTVGLYQRGKTAAPFEVKGTWIRQVVSQNSPVANAAIVDLNLFF